MVDEYDAPDRDGRRLDLAGAISGTLGLAALPYAVSGASEPEVGRVRDPRPAAGAALLGGFVAVERRSPAPRVPPSC